MLQKKPGFSEDLYVICQQWPVIILSKTDWEEEGVHVCSIFCNLPLLISQVAWA